MGFMVPLLDKGKWQVIAGPKEHGQRQALGYGENYQ
jgi:hypothetical protein